MNKNQPPLLGNLKKHISEEALSFHTPGHKNGKIIPPELINSWSKEIWKYDLTEIYNLDNLHAPVGCLKQAQEKAAKLFKAKSSYFLVNGSSVGLQAALLALSYQKQIFIPRHVHKSIYNGIILAKAQPIYLPVNLNKEIGIPLGIEPEVLENYLDTYPEVKTIIFPYPTYQGLAYKIKENIALAKKRGLMVILDEAHGSHFLFHQSLPPTGLSLGADLVVQSWHKTLPVLTQASVLHVNENYSGPDISTFINMLQTTSPSYLLLASLDACRSWLEVEGKTFLEETLKKINEFKNQMKDLENIEFLSFSKGPQDPLKLGITSSKLTGFQLADNLRKKHQIYVELAEENYCLLIFGIKIIDGELQRLKKAIREMDKMAGYLPHRKKPRIPEISFIPPRVITPPKAFFANKEEVNIKDALGRVAGEYIIKYPPGIPIVVPGEKISKEVIEILEDDISVFSHKDSFLVIANEEANL